MICNDTIVTVIVILSILLFGLGMIIDLLREVLRTMKTTEMSLEEYLNFLGVKYIRHDDETGAIVFEIHSGKYHNSHKIAGLVILGSDRSIDKKYVKQNMRHLYDIAYTKHFLDAVDFIQHNVLREGE